MKKKIFLYTICFLFSASEVFSQETGIGAENSSYAGKSSSWQNWVFAGSALVTATVGVVVISLNTGGYSH